MVDVSIKNLVKDYGGWRAVQGIDLDIADKEFLVLVGPSGCGKSTTLRMIAGLEEITSGEIWIDGSQINKLPPWQRDIAMVFQSYALYPHMTVFENMAFGLKLRKLPAQEIKVRVDKAAGILELGNLMNRKPKELSGGQRQRVAMGRALVRNPQVFLFDEPLSNLDAQLRLQMRTEIKRMHQAVRTTTIYVTHDQAEAMTLADRVVVMNQGQIEQIGTPHDIYHHPATRFVAGFIGSPAMNFLPAELRGEADDLKLVLNGMEQISLPAEWKERYSRYVGKPMIFGLRPEHLTASIEETRDKPAIAHFDLPVDLIETMGMETVVYSNVGGVQVIARVAPDSGAVQGQMLRVAADLNHMHLIEPDSGRVM